MATREQFKMTTAERRRRHFSDSFKIQKVREPERIIGQKQILIDFKDKMIDLTEKSYDINIKKFRNQ